MGYRRCGSSGLLLPEISLGFWHNFGTNDDYEVCKSIVHYAFDHGVTYFDLANNYGPPYGSAEETFGRIFMESLRPHRDELIIATKAGHDMWPGPYGEWSSRKSLIASLSVKIAELLRPADLKADFEIVYQTMEGLHTACPNHLGDWYFSGNYPTPGGVRRVNMAYIDYYEKNYIHN